MSGGCIFCAVVAHQTPASMVYEVDAVAAFLDLVSCSAEMAGRLFVVSAMLAPAILKATGAAAFNVWTANGRAAGQEVFHLHLHVLPRQERDQLGLRFPKGYPREAPRGELDAMAERVRAALSPSR